jgi:hypothetical protein
LVFYLNTPDCAEGSISIESNQCFLTHVLHSQEPVKFSIFIG